jgi:hypothetical protein
MIVPEPCGYVVLLLIANMQKTAGLKTACSSWCAVQRFLNQSAFICSISAPGNNKKKGKERKKEERRRGKGEDRRRGKGRR